VLELEDDEGIPVYVIPVRTPERIIAELKERENSGRTRRIQATVGMRR
jgi:hypothetical protein